MHFDTPISNIELVKLDAMKKSEKYKSPPKKYNLEEEMNKNYLEIKSFEKIKLEKSNCTKENCSCYEIKTAFESYSFKHIPLLSPNSLESQIENNNIQNKTTVISIINTINQRTNKNNIENSEETNKNKDNVVKNLINDLNDDDTLKTPILGLKRNISSSLFKHNYSEIQIVNNVFNEINSKEMNNYYIKEIKSKKYNQARIKYNKNYYLVKSFEKSRNQFDSNDKILRKKNKMRMIEFKKRARKTGDQIKQLNEIFKTCDEWDKKKINEVSEKTGLSVSQVYKWIWDQKRKCDNV